MSGDIVSMPAPINPIVALLAQPAARERYGQMAMQGYRPIIAITRNRRYCEYCGEGVFVGVFHVCWGNAEHHMATLTREDRSRILLQLADKPKKLTRLQLAKLYASDGKGPLEYESKKKSSGKRQ
jgi:hypothetical protein